MSYQFHMVSGVSSPELFKQMISALHSSEDCIGTFLKDESAGFKYKDLESNWGSDIELYLNADGLFLDIHARNAKKILALIDSYLKKLNILIKVEEL
ncbi:hypothetical protein WKH24_23330 [Pantoea agglomerans]|uniref:hypothetical protein n=1 Tax=Enterobacter agglomerans TaxID=549 RepID=UPI001A9FCAB9|nr:hypothetical protein [Pantoea agglomerans]QTC49154.1 hypothetical protein H0Z11_12840 [Pantoea agglomerans]